jgi:phospholipase/carboxylesterase
MLHGRGADEEDLLGLASMLDKRFLVISPRAPFPYSEGGGYTWYDVGTIGTPDPVRFPESCTRLSTFIADVLAGYPVDPGQLFLLGFSMGTVMSLSMALTHPELFRGVSANSGYLAENTHLKPRWNEIAHREFFITHGTLDPIIPVHMARRDRHLLESAGAHVTYLEYTMGHQMTEEGVAEISTWLTGLIDRRVDGPT